MAPSLSSRCIALLIWLLINLLNPKREREAIAYIEEEEEKKK
jgi:hypothetical protein